MSTTIRQEIAELNVRLLARFERERNRRIEALLKKRFGVTTFALARAENRLIVNTLEIVFKIDEYNNFHCSFAEPVMATLDELVPMRHVIVNLIENNSYRGRGGRGLFMSYFKQFEKQLTVKQVQRMIDLDGEFPQDRGEFTFWNWLNQELGHCNRKFKISQFRPWRQSEVHS